MKTKEIICPKCEYHFNGAISNDVWKCPHCGFKFIEARKKDKIESFEENESTEKEKTYGNISVLQLILKTNRNIFDWKIPTNWFQSFNPIFIIILAPIASYIWIFLEKKIYIFLPLENLL